MIVGLAPFEQASYETTYNGGMGSNGLTSARHNVLDSYLDKLRLSIHGMVHYSDGTQTKVLHFIENLHVVKNNLFPIPPLFKIAQSFGIESQIIGYGKPTKTKK